MSQSLVFTLLALALVLPVLGAILLRVLAARLSTPLLSIAAGLIFGVALASVLLLARANVSSLQVGGLSLLLPAGNPDVAAPATADQAPTPGRPAAPSAAPASTRPAVTPAASSTPTTAAEPTTAPTAESTATPTATPTPPPTPTPEPPTPTPTARPAARRTYVVQPGDTLRGIAEQFKVTVQALLEANNLTPEQADSLRPGQELVIP